MFPISIKSKFIALFAFSTVLTPFIAINPASTIAATPNKLETSQVSDKVLYAQNVNNNRSRTLYPRVRGNGKAMTWKMLRKPLTLGSKSFVYILFGSDTGKPGGTNPYSGDTNINEYRSLLCIKKTGIPAPAGLPPSKVSPGGATVGSWSGGSVLVIPNVQGRQLTSQAVADGMCERAGQRTRRTSGYRMAEFHDGNGKNAGWSFWAQAFIHDVQQDLNPSTRFWVNINDQPNATPWGSMIGDNVPSPSIARFQVSSSGVSRPKRLIRESPNKRGYSIESFRFEDFNGDGKTDIFTKLGGRLVVSYGGTSRWKPLLRTRIPLEKLRFGDFNGDGKTDIFTTFGGRFRVSYGGTSRWQPLAGTKIPLERFRFGDFNGDGKTDVFTVFGGRFQVSYGGTSNWQALGRTNIPLEKFRFGDFNGDGKTDVFTTFNSRFQVSYGGTFRWQPLAKTRTPLKRLRFGDFNGDGKTDVFTTFKLGVGGSGFQVSYGANSRWQPLLRTKIPLERLRFGDFNGDGKTDVFI